MNQNNIDLFSDIDFETELFNKIIKKNNVKVFLDKGEFQDFNNIEDIQNLKISF